jgi:hypothetical protein
MARGARVSVEAGPNAVLALDREDYRRVRFTLRDAVAVAATHDN